MSLEQKALETLPRRQWEVVVVGAGPAGAVCAWALADKGHKVLVIDKDRFPRDKPCGDMLITDAISLLADIGALEKVKSSAHEIPAMEIFSPCGIRFEVPGPFLSIRRRFLDMLLMEHACGNGKTGSVTFAQGNVVEIKKDKNGTHRELYCSDASEPIHARVIVLATGGVVTLPYRQRLVSSKNPTALAMRGYVRSRHRLDNTIIVYNRSLLPGYLWIIPLGEASDGFWLYNVGCGAPCHRTNNGQSAAADLKQTLVNFLDQSLLARPLMEKGDGLRHVQGAPLRCGLSDIGSACKENIVAVGEAIGTTYPFSGEGIGKAMESGQIAARIIHEALQRGDLSHLQQYTHHLTSVLKPRYASYAKAEKWLSHGWFSDFVARRICKSKYLQRTVREIIAETQDPRAVISIWGLLKSYWK
jgi:geranylgeranyl reductase family protein